ncbi:hypothetical protein [Pseudomonas sp. GOM6]|uniref:hypothetical protein n=1 Tax=Pseudomonas sp. GOM6 TaxID=3036944 RepID=UPI002409CF0C|nr:hypothetical protein [Pseudomonas sp. GOM6]MDG1580836.1 hypothetical protein [Pseudomonas sp. GOM6]
MRISPDEAVRLGLIDPSDGKTISTTSRRGQPVLSKAVASLNQAKLQALSEGARESKAHQANAIMDEAGKDRARTAGRGLAAGSKGYVEQETSPQKILFDALCARLPGRVQWEAVDLVPGREFSADIFIPPYVVVEMDGFAFHRSKKAFQSDRDRQNLFVSLGYRPIRAYTKQVLDATRLTELVNLIERAVLLDKDHV